MNAPWGRFCTYCGAPLPDTAFPRTCANNHTTYVNGLPVAVALQPVTQNGRTYLLTVRRNIAPFIGALALPGGFVDNGETFATCAARELREEANIIHINPPLCTFYQAVGDLHDDAPDPRRLVLQFEILPTLSADTIDLQHTSAETQGLVLVTYDPAQDCLCDYAGHSVSLCFPLHDHVARLFLQSVHDGLCQYNKLRN